MKKEQVSKDADNSTGPVLHAEGVCRQYSVELYNTFLGHFTLKWEEWTSDKCILSAEI